MSATLGSSRGGLKGFVDFVAPVAPANPAVVLLGSADDVLAACLAHLQAADSQLAALVDDDPAEAAIMAWMDTLLGQAATIRPVTDRGFGVKARIARVYGDCPAGEMVHLWLLSDLMIRGRAS